MYNWILGIASAAAEAAQTAAPAADAAAQPQISPIAAILTQVLPIALMVVAFYFLLIRPQKKKDRKVKEMLDNLKVGDRICTIGGIYGTISALREDSVTIKVGGQDTQMVITRWAIRNVEAVTVENDSEVLV